MFEAYYRENIPESRNGIVVPKEAVKCFKIRNGIVVPKEFVKCLKICHRKFSIISFDQPYYIGSIRFYIDQYSKYKFLIETTSNFEDWEELANKNDEFVNGWQTFRFTSKPICDIKIIPTACYSNEALDTFGIGIFESPSQV